MSGKGKSDPGCATAMSLAELLPEQSDTDSELWVPGTPYTDAELEAYAAGILEANRLRPGDLLVVDVTNFAEQGPLLSAVRSEAYARGIAVLLARLDVEGREEILAEGIRRNALFLQLSASAMGVDPMLPANAQADRRSGYLARKAANRLRWCIAVCPTMQWAQQVFPQLPPQQAYRQLGLQLLHFSHADQPGGMAAHLEQMQVRRDRLNRLGIQELHLTAPSPSRSGLGTDLRLRLHDRQRFELAGWEIDGRWMQANLPSEEIWGTPDPGSVSGRFECSRPVILDGQRFDGVWGRFEQGRLVDIGCQQPERARLLRQVFVDRPRRARQGDPDVADAQGLDSLGEIGLVANSSPVSESGLVFLHSIVDENSGCHLGLGDSYGSINVEGEDHGGNQADYHYDLTIGTPDMQVTGIDRRGEQHVILQEGAWYLD